VPLAWFIASASGSHTLSTADLKRIASVLKFWMIDLSGRDWGGQEPQAPARVMGEFRTLRYGADE
jgi:hypothetical protein